MLLDAKKNNIPLTFFYGVSDQWSPIEFANKMKERVNKINLNLQNKIFHKVLIDEDAFFEHAFVIRESSEMAIKLCLLICE